MNHHPDCPCEACVVEALPPWATVQWDRRKLKVIDSIEGLTMECLEGAAIISRDPIVIKRLKEERKPLLFNEVPPMVLEFLNRHCTGELIYRDGAAGCWRLVTLL